jgi:predicted acetyltransferase
MQKSGALNLRLVEPSRERLPSYAAVLATGWSPNNVANVSAEQLAAIREDPDAFLAELIRQGGTITLPDGASVPRLPFIVRWMWDGEFCGSVSLRWRPGSDELPPYVLGHIGYAVVPWKRGRGYATEALRSMLDEARSVGLARLQITTDPGNRASQRVIEINGGRLVEEFVNERYGSELRLRYVIDLRPSAPAKDTP